MSSDCIPREPDGFYHPASEDELVCLVKLAYREGRELRVRGAAHSVAHAVYTDPLGDFPNHVNQESPPPGDNLNVMLDRYRSWSVRDEERRLVEAQAGINLGADPSDPKGTATLEASLLWQLWDQKGWTLGATGGITHQTVSGFTATGSAGGSVNFSSNDNLWGFRVIDGRGDVYEVTRDDPDPDRFFSMSPSMGLLGVVSTITFECDETFNISGQEATTTIDGCSIDLFGPGDEKRVPLERWLREVDYGRIDWWPQRDVDRVVVWQAQRIPAQPGFRPVPYEQFSDDPNLDEVLISVLYTIIGNLDDLDQAKPKLEATFEQVEDMLELLPVLERLGAVGKALAKFLSHAVEFGVDAAITVLEPFAGLIKREIPDVFPKLIGTFVALDSAKKGMEKDEPQCFRDWAWRGMPMDNQASDILVPMEFTELWIPLPRTQQVMELLKGWFDEPDDPHESYARTGLTTWELYMAKPTSFWLNASHTTGDDEWRDGAFRVDPFWFAANPGDPAVTFYPPLWELLRDAGVPYRLHWGKYQPVFEAGDRRWVDFLRSHYPRWDDFLALREERDPNNIFLSAYWRDRFGLLDAPPPAPVP